jgi:pimeloyl-ACP methyl ester carboxylesterase
MLRLSCYLLLSLLITSSCALNKIFLHPFPLNTTDDFSTYVKEVHDTLTMTFTESKVPMVHTSTGEIAELSYNLECVLFPNSNGDTLNAWYFAPKENYNGHTIYFLHGNAGNLVYQYPLVTPFVNAGYQVFMVDYSGFGFSQGKATRKNVHQDAQDGLDYMLGRSDIKYEKLIMYGQSLGGHLSVVLAEENQEVIDGLVIEGAFSSHSDIAGSRVPILGRIFTREMYSAERSIPKLFKPVLVIHSTEDQTIPIKHGKRLYSLANEPKSMYTIDQRHILGPLYYADSIDAKMRQLVK